MTLDETQDDSPPRQVARGLWLILAPVLAIGLLALSTGMIAGAFAAGKYGTGFWIAVGLAVFVIAATIWLIRTILPNYALPRSPRMRSARLALYASGAIGIGLGMLLVLVSPNEPDRMWEHFAGTSTLPLPAALLLLAGLAIAMVISVRWHRLLDEHERAAYDFGAVAAIYVYFALSVGWWLLWRSALVAEPSGIAIFFVVMTVWLVAWVVRRFR